MRIVFFGDSITDCDRDRNDETSLGNGYVKILADKLRPIYPDMDIDLINKGVSGNEVCDLLARVQRDVIDYKPDAVVIMIGINNVIHKFKYGKELNLNQFERDLKSLIKKLKDAGIVVIFLEPFLLPAPDKKRMRTLFNQELEIIHRVCVEMCDEFVAYDEMFNGLCITMPYTVYSEDGVHPTFEGSDIIANTAIKGYTQAPYVRKKMQGKRLKLTLMIMLMVFILFALFGVIVLSLGNNMGIVAIVVGGAAVFPVVGELARQEKRVQNPDGGRKNNDGRDNKEE